MQYRCLILVLLVLFGLNLDRASGQTARKQAQPPPNIKNTTNSISSATSTAPSAELNVEAKGWVEAGIKQVEAGQYSQAIESFQHAVKLQPGYADAYSALGRAYFKTRQWQKSSDTLRHAAFLHEQEARLQKLRTEKRGQVITPVQSIPSPEKKPAPPANTNAAGTKTTPTTSGATQQIQQQVQLTTPGKSAAAPDNAPRKAPLSNSTSGNSSAGNAQSNRAGNTPPGNTTNLSAGNAQIKSAGNTTPGNSPPANPSAGNAQIKSAGNTTPGNSPSANPSAGNAQINPAANTTPGNSPSANPSAGNAQIKSAGNTTPGNSPSANPSAGNAQIKSAGNTTPGNSPSANPSAGNAQINPAANTTPGNSPSANPSAGNAQIKSAGNTTPGNSPSANPSAGNAQIKSAGNTTPGNSPSANPSAGNAQINPAANTTPGNSPSANPSAGNAQIHPAGNTTLGNSPSANPSAGNAQTKSAGNTTPGNSPSANPSAGNAQIKPASNTPTRNTPPDNLSAGNTQIKPAGNESPGITAPGNLNAANGQSKSTGNTTPSNSPSGNSSGGDSPRNPQQATNAFPNPSSQPAPHPKETGTPINAPVSTAKPQLSDSALVAVTTADAKAEVVVPEPKGDEKNGPELKRDAIGEQVSAAASSPEAKRATPIAISVSSDDASLTRIYRIGPNDILDVRINDLQSPQSTLFTVTSAGLLEHPSLTEPLLVSGFTAEEIGTKIKAELSARALLENPAVSVGVRDYASHTILVSGLVKDSGTRFLRREAIPLYVVVADAQPLPEAARVTVVRNELRQMYEIDLTRPEEMNLLVRPGDVVTLHPNATQFLYIGGEVKSPGEKTFRRGLTLMQAIISAGGAAPKAKVAEVSRDDGRGFLAVSTLNLKDIQSGKVVDPLLRPGDRIMILR